VFVNRFDRVLAIVVAGGLFLLGVGELVSRLDEPGPLLFWLPTLWGGAALVVLGSFRASGNTSMSKAFVIIGALLGLTPSAWTVVLPILIITLVVRTVASRPESEAASL
jgi:hypothetical protein